MNSNIKPKKMNEFSRLLQLMKPRIVPYTVGVFGQGLTTSGLAIAMAYSLKYMIDAAMKKEFTLLTDAGLLIISTTLMVAVLLPFFYYMIQRSIMQTMAGLRTDLFAHLQKLPLGFFESRHSGDLVSRINNDIQTTDAVYSQNILAVVATSLNGLASVIFMLQLNWQLSLLFIILSILMAGVNLLFAEPIRRLSDGIQDSLGSLTERLIDILNGYPVIKMFHLEKIMNRKYTEQNDTLTRQSIKRVNTNALLDSSNYLLGMLNFAGLISIGAFLVLNKSVEFGTLTALVHLQINVTQAFLGLGSFIPKLQVSLAGAARIFEIMDQSPEPQNYQISGSFNTREFIRFEQVDFEYQPHEKILENFSMSVTEGQVAALIGLSGSGKSTIIKLLLGFYPPTGGNIMIAGKPLESYPLDELREMIAYVPQESYLFDGTIKENIQYGCPGASEEEIVKAAVAANAHNFITQLPEQYETMVGEGGAKLSGGQRQRVAIARAVLKNAPVLLLDEATSALDSESEQLVQKALGVLMKGKTVIIIAHRLSTIKNADVIFCLNQGKLIEQGKHDQLIDNQGFYSYLYNT